MLLNIKSLCWGLAGHMARVTIWWSILSYHCHIKEAPRGEWGGCKGAKSL
jgi:hypothetical protein